MLLEIVLERDLTRAVPSLARTGGPASVLYTETRFRATHSPLRAIHRAPGQDPAKLTRNRIT